MKIFSTYITALITFLAIDAVWLGLIAKNFYKSKLGELMSPQVNWVAAVIFYLLFIAGLMYFVILPGLKNGSVLQVLLAGALFGLIAYATYDLTNLATLKNWPLSVTIIDLIWGAFISAVVSVVAYIAAVKWF